MKNLNAFYYYDSRIAGLGFPNASPVIYSGGEPYFYITKICFCDQDISIGLWDMAVVMPSLENEDDLFIQLCNKGWFLEPEIMFAHSMEKFFDENFSTKIHAKLLANVITNTTSEEGILFTNKYVDFLTNYLTTYAPSLPMCRAKCFDLHGTPRVMVSMELANGSECVFTEVFIIGFMIFDMLSNLKYKDLFECIDYLIETNKQGVMVRLSEDAKDYHKEAYLQQLKEIYGY